ncbi:glycosyltransferase, partial [bacterium]|nr:glycosyltransferase [bacterium]
MKDELCILVFGHARPLCIADVLESLHKQGAISNVSVWLDGHQGRPDVKYKTELVREVVAMFPVREVVAHNGSLGFRKLILHALDDAAAKYRYIIVLEDDCFPTRDAVKIFTDELAKTENDESIFSIYGHPFLVPDEGVTFS